MKIAEQKRRLTEKRTKKFASGNDAALLLLCRKSATEVQAVWADRCFEIWDFEWRPITVRLQVPHKSDQSSAQPSVPLVTHSFCAIFAARHAGSTPFQAPSAPVSRSNSRMPLRVFAVADSRGLSPFVMLIMRWKSWLIGRDRYSACRARAYRFGYACMKTKRRSSKRVATHTR